jgi:hypothetical protein
MFTSIKVIKFGFGNSVINANSWEWKAVSFSKFIESVDSGSSFFTYSFAFFDDICEESRVFWNNFSKNGI